MTSTSNGPKSPSVKKDHGQTMQRYRTTLDHLGSQLPTGLSMDLSSTELMQLSSNRLKSELPLWDLTFLTKVDALLGDRLLKKINREDPNECWSWIGWRNADGYGCIDRRRSGGGIQRAHRVVYE